MERVVDVAFPVLSHSPIPADHGSALYAAIARACPELHGEDGVGIHPITGRSAGPRSLQPMGFSRVVIRLPSDRIDFVLPLAGQRLQIHNSPLDLGLPEVRALVPAATLRSRLVTTRNGLECDRFRQELRRQLDLLKVSSEVQIDLPLIENHDPPRRRTIRIRGREIVGHEVVLKRLTEGESLEVQIHGLGGRRVLGCGVFVPFAAERTPRPRLD